MIKILFIMDSYKQLFICIIIGSFFSCTSKNSQDESVDLTNHLSTSLVENPRTLDRDSLANNQFGKLVFEDTIHDFGRVKENEIVTFDFDFMNEGKKDVLISEAKASCGCTVPSYPQIPIKYGEKNKVSISFNSQGKKGYNEKLTILYTNANPSMYNLYIRAEVY
jgi:hypothetical protein